MTGKFFKRTHDPLWQLQIGIIAVAILQFFTSDGFLPYPKSIIIICELVLMVGLAIFTSGGYSRISSIRRVSAIILVIIIALINLFSLVFLTIALISSSTIDMSIEDVLKNSLTIYATNIFMFALLYWELDGGGPDHRVAALKRRDFIFPQMIYRGTGNSNWQPGYVDYLYLSTTNVTNFASADTMPISHRAKLLMMIQALISVVLVVLVIARTISIIN